jgi:hypothetical protein
MGVLNEDVLTDKQSVNSQKLLSISFEYLLAGFANEHASLYQYTSIKQFNESNRLTWPVLLSYPFFVSLANGNSKSLYKLFGPFYGNQYGPVSVSVYQLLENEKENGFIRKFKHFNNPLSSGNNIQVLDSRKAFLQIQKELKEEILELEEMEKQPFKEFEIDSDKTNLKPQGGISLLHEAIDNSIKIIQDQSGNTFFDGDIRTIIHHSTFYEALRKAFEAEVAPLISYDDVDAVEFRPFYREDLVS